MPYLVYFIVFFLLATSALSEEAKIEYCDAAIEFEKTNSIYLNNELVNTFKCTKNTKEDFEFTKKYLNQYFGFPRQVFSDIDVGDRKVSNYDYVKMGQTWLNATKKFNHDDIRRIFYFDAQIRAAHNGFSNPTHAQLSTLVPGVLEGRFNLPIEDVGICLEDIVSKYDLAKKQKLYLKNLEGVMKGLLTDDVNLILASLREIDIELSKSMSKLNLKIATECKSSEELRSKINNYFK
jgi:hypothetical protein